MLNTKVVYMVLREAKYGVSIFCEFLVEPLFGIFFRFMMKKMYSPIKTNKDDLENFETHKKLIHHFAFLLY